MCSSAWRCRPLGCALGRDVGRPRALGGGAGRPLGCALRRVSGRSLLNVLLDVVQFALSEVLLDVALLASSDVLYSHLLSRQAFFRFFLSLEYNKLKK